MISEAAGIMHIDIIMIMFCHAIVISAGASLLELNVKAVQFCRYPRQLSARDVFTFNTSSFDMVTL